MIRVAFALAAADYENVGDALIRRQAIAWLSDYNQVNLYVGSGGDDWVRALEPQATARVWVRSKVIGWLLELARSRKPLLLFDPGEVRLGRDARRQEAFFLFVTLLARLRGGTVVRHARGIAGSDSIAVALHRASCRLSQEVTWRNQSSRELIGWGDVVPDIAFGEVASLGHDDQRGRLVVSLRGDRPLPGIDWVASVRDFASVAGLELVCVTQVRGDTERTQELAALLDCDAVGFGSQGLLGQEALLRRIYGQTRLVLSDRLHVLVLAALCGAAPVELVPAPNGKIQAHFETVGLRGVSHDSRVMSREEMIAAMAAAVSLDRLDEVEAILVAARAQVDLMGAGVSELKQSA